jgi:hypothetical protein
MWEETVLGRKTRYWCTGENVLQSHSLRIWFDVHDVRIWPTETSELEGLAACCVCATVADVLWELVWLDETSHLSGGTTGRDWTKRLICPAAQQAEIGEQQNSHLAFWIFLNPLNPELNPICYLLVLLAHHFLHVSRISVKLLTLRLLMSYIYIYIYIYIYMTLVA